MKLTKSILRVGKHEAAEGTVEVTPERLRHWNRMHRKIRQKGYIVPSSWDHDQDLAKAVPIKIDQIPSARDNVGKLHSFKLADDGQSAEVVLELTDAKAAEKAKNNDVFISPVIHRQWTTGDGEVLKDVLTHVDLVNWPVDRTQTPFRPAADPKAEVPVLAMALRAPIKIKNRDKYFTFRMALGDDDMAEKDDPIDEGGEGEGDPGAPAADAKKVAKQVMDLIGATVPAEFDPLTAAGFTLFATAVLNKLSSNDLDDAGGPDAGAGEPPPGGDFASMGIKPSDYQALSVGARTALAHANKQHRESIENRLEVLQLTGRVTPAEFEVKRNGLGAVQLSLSRNGDPRKSSLEIFIESREALPANAVTPIHEQIKMGIGNPIDAPGPIHANRVGQEDEKTAQANADYVFAK